jgi:hypothetical protein
MAYLIDSDVVIDHLNVADFEDIPELALYPPS